MLAGREGRLWSSLKELGPWTEQEERIGKELHLVSTCCEPGAFHASSHLSDPLRPSEAGGIILPFSRAVTCLSSFSLEGTRLGVESKTLSPTPKCSSLRGQALWTALGMDHGATSPEEQASQCL